MESAGAGEMPEDAERKGIGTPATRASILEKLVATGLVERKRARKITSLLPTQAGSSLVAVLPEVLRGLEKVCAAGFSAYTRWNELSIWNHVKTVIQSMVGFSRCKVAA